MALNIPDRFKRLAKNVALAALAAGVTGFTTAFQLLPEQDRLSRAALIACASAAGYAALRAAAGVLKAAFGEPFEVDTPPASGPDPAA